MKDHAIALARDRGFCVFPLSGKIPFKGTRGHLDATKDLKEIESLWEKYPNANIGIATGVRSNVIVLDIDGADGYAALKALGYEIPDTLSVKTGRGMHYYFQHPGIDLRSFAGRLPSVDLRAEGGYVVAPPSIHPDTKKPYKWIDDEMRAELPPLWLNDLAENKGGAKKTAIKEGATLGKGERNEQLFKLACRWRGEAMDQDQIEALLRLENEKRCSPPLPEKEIKAIAKSSAGYSPTSMEVPDWEVLKATMIASGVTDEETLKKAKEQHETAKAEKTTSSAIDVELVHRTATRKQDSIYDVIVYWNGAVILTSGVPAEKVIEYKDMRKMCFKQGHLLPALKNGQKIWEAALRAALEKMKRQDMVAESDHVALVVEFLESWIDEQGHAESLEELVERPSLRVAKVKGKGVYFLPEAFYRSVKEDLSFVNQKVVAAVFDMHGITKELVRVGRRRVKMRFWNREAIRGDMSAPEESGSPRSETKAVERSD